MAVERLFIVLSMTFDTNLKRNSKDTLENLATRQVIKSTFAQYSRLTAKRHDSKLLRDYLCNTTVMAIVKKNENSVEDSYILYRTLCHSAFGY